MIGLLQLIQLQVLPRRPQFYLCCTGLCGDAKTAGWISSTVEGNVENGTRVFILFRDGSQNVSFYSRVAEVSSSLRDLILNGKRGKRKRKKASTQSTNAPISQTHPNVILANQLVLKGRYFSLLFLRGSWTCTPAYVRAASDSPAAGPAALTLYLCTSCQNSTSFSRNPPFRQTKCWNCREVMGLRRTLRNRSISLEELIHKPSASGERHREMRVTIRKNDRTAVERPTACSLRSEKWTL